MSIGHHHEQHSNYPDQEAHNQQMTSVETNGHGHPSRWEGSSPLDGTSGISS